MKKALTFFDLPLEIRQRIYNINIEEKLKPLADRQYYYDSMVCKELEGINMEIKHFRDEVGQQFEIMKYIRYSRKVYAVMGVRRVAFARQQASDDLWSWLMVLEKSTYEYLFNDVNRLEDKVKIKYARWKEKMGIEDSESDEGSENGDSESDSDSD